MCTAYALHSRALRRSANAPYTAAQMAHQELDRLVESAAPDEVVLAAWETGDVDVVRAWLEDGGRWGGVRNLDERVFIDTWPAGQPHSIQRRTLVSGTLLTVACKSEHPSPIAEMLLDAGADCNTQHLIDAIGSGNICAVRALVPRLDMDEGYGLWSPLHFACAGGTWGNQIVLPNQVEIVHALLEAGAPVNGRTRRLGGMSNRPYGLTPLMKAAQQGFTRLGVVKWLLHYGADIAAADTAGHTALFHANELFQYSHVWHDATRKAWFWDQAMQREIPCRTPGVVEDMLALLQGVEAAGSWKRYVREPRKQLLVLRRLVERGRAAPPDGVLARLFPESGGLPDVLFWKVLSFWRSSRDA